MKFIRTHITGTIAILLPILLLSCARGGFTEVYDLPLSIWSATEAINFEFTPSDSVSPHNIDLIVRRSNEFPYDKLILEVKTITPSQLFWYDTIAIPLTGSDGKCTGQKYSEGYDLNINYRRDVVFAEGGAYGIALRQLTGQDTLKTITAVGISVYPEEK